MNRTKAERIAAIVVLVLVATVAIIAATVGTVGSSSLSLGAFGIVSLTGSLRHTYLLGVQVGRQRLAEQLDQPGTWEQLQSEIPADRIPRFYRMF